MKRLFRRLKEILSKLKDLVSGKFRLFLCVLFVMFFGLLCLPSVSVKIGDQVINLPQVDLKTLDASAEIGNFRRGRDVYPSSEVKAQIDFGAVELNEQEKEEYLNNTLNTISKRLALANLHDVDLRGEIENSNYYLVFNYPNYYENIDLLTKALTKKGEIVFVAGDSQQPLELKDYDVSTNIDVVYNPAIQTHLKFGFSPNKTIELQTAMLQQYFFMQIDGEIEYQVFQYEQSDVLTNTVRALPLITETQGNLVLRELYMNITRTYFTEEVPLQFSAIVEESITTVPAIFGSQSTQYLAILLSLVFVAITILTLIKYRFRKTFTFAFMLLSLLVFTVAFLKYISTSISFVFIVAFFVLTAMGVVFMWRFIVSENRAALEKTRKQFLMLGILLFLIAWTILRFVPDLGRFYDALSPILVFAIGFMILAFFNFKVLVEEIILKRLENE